MLIALHPAYHFDQRICTLGMMMMMTTTTTFALSQLPPPPSFPSNLRLLTCAMLTEYASATRRERRIFPYFTLSLIRVYVYRCNGYSTIMIHWKLFRWNMSATPPKNVKFTRGRSMHIHVGNVAECKCVNDFYIHWVFIHRRYGTVLYAFHRINTRSNGWLTVRNVCEALEWASNANIWHFRLGFALVEWLLLLMLLLLVHLRCLCNLAQILMVDQHTFVCVCACVCLCTDSNFLANVFSRLPACCSLFRLSTITTNIHTTKMWNPQQRYHVIQLYSSIGTVSICCRNDSFHIQSPFHVIWDPSLLLSYMRWHFWILIPISISRSSVAAHKNL